VEQARERRALTVQLQAFIPEPGSGRMLLLTLACPSTHGWSAHQELFARLVVSARGDDAVDDAVDEVPEPESTPESTPEPVRRRPAPVEEESFEAHTYQL
jgi:hypothetical protein